MTMTATHPFRLGVIAEHMHTRDEVITTARRVESAGFATLLLRDHFIAEPFGNQLAPFPTLALAAAVTTTLRVGTMVIDNDYRHPVMLAKEAATLDLLSGGRLELGIGAGWARDEYAAAGMPYDPAGVRITRFAESVRILKGLWSGEPFRFTGEHYTISDLTSFPLPTQRPLPLLIGGGAKRMLSLAAREADIVSVLTSSVASGTMSTIVEERTAPRVAEKIGWIRDAAGSRFGALELSVIITLIVTDDREAAARQYADGLGWHDIAVADVLAMPAVFIGTVGEIATDMRARREEFGFSYFVVSDRVLADAALVVARLAGT